MKIELRKYNRDDVQELAKMANNKEVSRYLRDFFPFPYLLKDATTFIEQVIKLPIEQGIEFAIIIDGQFAGAIGATFEKDIYRRTCELGYWLGAPFWGHGIMSKAIEMFTKYLFETFAVHKITAEVFSHNIGSQKILEKSNFQLEGTLRQHAIKDGVYCDLKIYGLLKDEYKS